MLLRIERLGKVDVRQRHERRIGPLHLSAHFQGRPRSFGRMKALTLLALTLVSLLAGCTTSSTSSSTPNTLQTGSGGRGMSPAQEAETSRGTASQPGTR